MITNSPYGLTNVIKPGRVPEPLQPIHTCDPQEAIDTCLSCKVKGGCRPESSLCKLYRPKRNKKSKGIGKGGTRAALRVQRDEKILQMIRCGWRNKEVICQELGIGMSTLNQAIQRIRDRGDIP